MLWLEVAFKLQTQGGFFLLLLFFRKVPSASQSSDVQLQMLHERERTAPFKQARLLLPLPLFLLGVEGRHRVSENALKQAG